MSTFPTTEDFANAPLFRERTTASYRIQIDDPSRVHERVENLLAHLSNQGVPVDRNTVEIHIEDNDLATVFLSRLGPAVRVVRRGNQAWIENDDEPKNWDDLEIKLYRVTESGQPICRCASPLSSQLLAMGDRDDPEFSRHHLDLADLRRSINLHEVDNDARVDVHGFDLLNSGLKDDVVPQDEIDAFVAGRRSSDPRTRSFPPRQARKPLRFCLSIAGVYPTFIGNIGELSSTLLEPVRAIGRQLLAPHIGDFPMEHMTVVMIGRDENPDAMLRYWEEGELVREIGAFTHPAMPGYRTSDARIWRRDGWDAIVFSDLAGTYAYAMPSLTRNLNLDVHEGEEPRAPRM